MAHLRCDFFSDVLDLSTSMTVLLPESTTEQTEITGVAHDDPPPVLYLLHGLSDDDTIWSRRTSIERYAASRRLAVVMPQVHHSFYTDQIEGLDFWTFLTEELPRIVQSLFRVSALPEDTFVAGLSMGGYGAMKWGLRQPERFAAVASLSGVLGLSNQHGQQDPWFGAYLQRTFAPGTLDGSVDDVMHLIRTADASALPPLYVACGTSDFLFHETVAFIEEAEKVGASLTTDVGPGDHDWDYWDAQIRKVVDWLPLR